MFIPERFPNPELGEGVDTADLLEQGRLLYPTGNKNIVPIKQPLTLTVLGEGHNTLWRRKNFRKVVMFVPKVTIQNKRILTIDQ